MLGWDYLLNSSPLRGRVSFCDSPGQFAGHSIGWTSQSRRPVKAGWIVEDGGGRRALISYLPVQVEPECCGRILRWWYNLPARVSQFGVKMEVDQMLTE